MKEGIHPDNYRFVVFRDVSCDFEFLTRSTVNTEKTTTFNGTEYPTVNIDISAQSHPFYTGTQKIMDTEGRVERFYRKYGFQKPTDADSEEADSAVADSAVADSAVADSAVADSAVADSDEEAQDS